MFCTPSAKFSYNSFSEHTHFFANDIEGTDVEPVHITRGKGSIRFREIFVATHESKRSSYPPEGPFRILYDSDWAEFGTTPRNRVPKDSFDIDPSFFSLATFAST